jgi:hypothetical protein
MERTQAVKINFPPKPGDPKVSPDKGVILELKNNSGWVLSPVQADGKRRIVMKW